MTNTKVYDGTTSAAAIPTVSGLEGQRYRHEPDEVYATQPSARNKVLTVSAYTVNDGNSGNNYAVNLLTTTPA